MKRTVLIIIFISMTAVWAVEESQIETETYDSITASADFNYKPVYEDVKYGSHDLIEDIKVSAVEGAAFGFLYSLFYVLNFTDSKKLLH